MADVGVGEQQVFRRVTERARRLDTLRLRPDLARPARWQRLRA